MIRSITMVCDGSTRLALWLLCEGGCRYSSVRLPYLLYTAVNCTVTVDHVEAQCYTAPGVGQEHQWTLEIAGQVGSVSTDQSVSLCQPE
jgi:hypothetical protein